MVTTATCCIAGGGPAGAVLGHLLARAGVDVVVLEKHGDFLRDFRGDTIHPSTAQLMDEPRRAGRHHRDRSRPGGGRGRSRLHGAVGRRAAGRLPRRTDRRAVVPRRPRARDPGTAFGRVARGHMLVMIDRGEYWQAGYLIRKDGLGALQAQGLDAFRHSIATLAPFLADRVRQIASWDDVRLLRVQLNRLRRWWQPGLLCIGDAAHAMSPVGGVGINLAVQDAVAAARILAPPLREQRLGWWHLARVQLRRTVPTVLTQAAQQVAHDRVLSRIVSGQAGGRAPLALRILDRVPALRAIPAWLIGRGVLSEHAPPPR
ncbi:MAG TPA: FAD-dependent monooxygenase [Euzebyales bacterium]|nr:FAD-dependent monooxygenase [Euzebyales bacterium]